MKPNFFQTEPKDLRSIIEATPAYQEFVNESEGSTEGVTEAIGILKKLRWGQLRIDDFRKVENEYELFARDLIEWCFNFDVENAWIEHFPNHVKIHIKELYPTIILTDNSCTFQECYQRAERAAKVFWWETVREDH